MKYKLDNVGKLYVDCATKKWSCVFRLSAVLNSTVDKEKLQQAVCDVFFTFPTIFAILKKGVFCHCLESNKKIPIIQRDSNSPCKSFDIWNDDCLIRILYGDYRISIEFFHGITDGVGGWIFFKALLERYFLILDLCIKLDVYHDKTFYSGIQKDAYKKIFYKTKGVEKFQTKKAYQVDGYKTNTNKYFLTHFEMNCKNLKEVAREYGVNVGQLFVSIIAYALMIQRQEGYINEKKSIVINLSYDLRRIFCIDTMQNFFGVLYITIEDDIKNFNELIKFIKHKCSSLTKEYIKDYFIKTNNNNIMLQNSILSKCLPEFIKKNIVDFGYKIYGERNASISFSNYGKIELSKELLKHVYRLESIMGVAKSSRAIESSLVTFGTKTVFTLCSKLYNKSFEKKFEYVFDMLGIKFVIDNNR